ncbi:isopentenyl-diphosphate Delta-isomerase I-like [Rhodamnia argentea]|uniref:isopentenyl-diphosphate Delta-isomerase n=1 Tax=Rhodamnia argentea TaxID=178133 RepID=A0A8B8QGU0_9MYRT|nr:isopentenyl-diphosphate Delta-isomerase I-like [Rhodamnia argentea]
MEKIESENLLLRAFSLFLFNSKHELLLQQRSATKVTFPLVWTNTCCSHPVYRESKFIAENALGNRAYIGARNAAQRKLLDEVGIPAEDVPVDEFIPLGRMLYEAPSDGKWGEHELDYFLFTVLAVKVNPNPDEVADIKYVNREQLKELLRKADAGEGGLKLSPWFRLVVDNFWFRWWDHLEKGTLEEAADMKTIHKLT